MENRDIFKACLLMFVVMGYLRLLTCNSQIGIGTSQRYWQYGIDVFKYLLPHSIRRFDQLAQVCSDFEVDLLALDAGLVDAYHVVQSRFSDHLPVFAVVEV